MLNPLNRPETIVLAKPDPLVGILLSQMNKEVKPVIRFDSIKEFNRAHNILTVFGEILDQYETILDDSGRCIYAVDIYPSITIIYGGERI